jgi:hypothetical protein
MSGAIHPLPQYAFMAWCLVKSTGTILPLHSTLKDLRFAILVQNITSHVHFITTLPHTSDTYHIDELYEGKTESNIHFLCHVLHGSDQLVVPSKQISHQPLLVLRTPTCNTEIQLSTL